MWAGKAPAGRQVGVQAVEKLVLVDELELPGAEVLPVLVGQLAWEEMAGRNLKYCCEQVVVLEHSVQVLAGFAWEGELG